MSLRTDGAEVAFIASMTREGNLLGIARHRIVGGEPSWVEVQFSRPMVVYGEIRDAESGDRVQGVEVRCTNIFRKLFPSAEVPAYLSIISEDGEYRFEYLQSEPCGLINDGIPLVDRYLVSAVCEGYEQRGVGVRREQGGVIRADIDLFRKDRSARVPVLLIDASRKPVRGGRVTVAVTAGATTTHLASVAVSDAGVADLVIPQSLRRRVEVGSARVQALAWGPRTQVARLELTLPDLVRSSTNPLVIGLESGLALSGIVFDSAGLPVEGLNIEVLSGEEVLSGALPPGLVDRYVARTDVNGQFRFEGLSGGDYRLVLRRSVRKWTIEEGTGPHAAGSRDVVVRVREE